MGLQKPGDADDMLEPGAWPNADETKFREVAQACTDALQRLVSRAAIPWGNEVNDTFKNGGGYWVGGAAGAAHDKGLSAVRSFIDMRLWLTLSANWNDHMHNVITNAKIEIINNVNAAKDAISKIAKDDPDYSTLVHNRKVECYNKNLGVVERAAGGVESPSTYHPRISEHELVTNGLPTPPPTIGAAPPPPASAPGESKPDSSGRGPAGAPVALPTGQTPNTVGGSNSAANQQNSRERSEPPRLHLQPSSHRPQPTQHLVTNSDQLAHLLRSPRSRRLRPILPRPPFPAGRARAVPPLHRSHQRHRGPGRRAPRLLAVPHRPQARPVEAAVLPAA